MAMAMSMSMSGLGPARLSPEPVPRAVIDEGPEAVETWRRICQEWAACALESDRGMMAHYCIASARWAGVRQAIDDPGGGQYAHLAAGALVRIELRLQALLLRVELQMSGRAWQQAMASSRLMGRRGLLARADAEAEAEGDADTEAEASGDAAPGGRPKVTIQ